MVRLINPFDEEAPPVFGGFPAESLVFLRTLSKNNNREWFTEHRNDYLQFVKEPMESLLSVLVRPMREMLPGIEIDPKKSVYRIYRDIRFSQDKSPYKTHAGASFTVAGRDRKYDPGYYFHISPDEVVIAGGAYMIPAGQLKILRQALSERHEEFRNILASTDFVSHFGKLDGDSLTRIPREYSAGHPAEDLLKMKSMYCWAQIKPEIATHEDFVEILLEYFRTMTPLIAWQLKYSVT